LAFFAGRVSKIDAVNDAIASEIAPPIQHPVLVGRGDGKEIACDTIVGESVAILYEHAPEIARRAFPSVIAKCEHAKLGATIVSSETERAAIAFADREQLFRVFHRGPQVINVACPSEVGRNRNACRRETEE
jgi:hypothetical protein